MAAGQLAGVFPYALQEASWWLVLCCGCFWAASEIQVNAKLLCHQDEANKEINFCARLIFVYVKLLAHSGIYCYSSPRVHYAGHTQQ